MTSPRPTLPAATRPQPAAPAPAVDPPAVQAPGPAGPVAPDRLWEQVLAAVAQRPALSWVQRSTTLEGVSGNVVRLGQRGGQRFLPTNQKQQLEELIGSLLGRRVTLEWVTASPRGEASASGPAQGGRRADYTASHREAAMNLPLVRQVFDVFGDATLLNVRPQAEVEAERSAAAEAEPAKDAPAAADDDAHFDLEETDPDV